MPAYRTIRAGALMAAAACCLIGAAHSQDIPPPWSSAWTAYPGASIYAVPGRLGSPLTAAHAPGGAIVDATITAELLDWSGYPVEGYPADDIWLEAAAGSFAFAPYGTVADGPTDQNGRTVWTRPLDGGGWTSGPLVVLVGGVPLPSEPLDLSINSADQDGDLLVNLRDLVLLGEPFWGTYTYSADLNYDGQINVSDIFRFWAAYQAVEPAPPGGPPGVVYASCQHRLGAFFSDGYLHWDQRRDEATNLDYPPNLPFEMHLVALSCSQPVQGYELSLEVHDAIIALQAEFPGGGMNLGDPLNHLAAFATPQPPVGLAGAVLLATVTFFPVEPQVSSVIRMLPSTPSSLGGAGPALVIGGQLVRANFAPYSHSGCLEPLAPGDLPAYVATTWGSGVPTAVVDDPLQDLPAAPAIAAVSPNPFNPRATITYVLPRAGEATLQVHDSRGRLVRTLAAGSLNAGRHEVVWDGLDAAGVAASSGVYLVRLVTAAGASAAKITLVR